jgi:MFS transporter, DHA2 family, multidrug resistance protein
MANVVTIAGGRASITSRDLNRLLFGLGLATAMQFYTFDSVNLILPDMAGALGASRDEASWILVSFSAAMFLGIPLASYFARRVGMLHYMVGSILVFLAASIGASLSTHLSEMVVFRSIEGFAGGSLNFWWRGSVYTFLTGPPRSAAMMRISSMLYLATTIGLLVSGFLVDHMTWRFLWVLDGVFAAGAICLLLRYFPRLPPEPEFTTESIDRFGLAFLGVALISLQVVLSRGLIDDWFGSPLIVALSLAAVIALVLLVFRELDPRNRRPLLKLPLLLDRNMLAAVTIGALAGMILAGSIYALPEYLRGIDPQPRSASQTGAILCVYSITAACARPLVTEATARFGQRKVVAFALLSLIGSMLLMAQCLTSNTPVYDYAAPLVLYGLCLAPLLSGVGSGTAARVAGAAQIDAVTIYMTVRQFGVAAGVALVNIVIERRESLHTSRLFEHLRSGDTQLQTWLAATSDQIVEHTGRTQADAPAAALALLHQASAHQASTLAFADAFRAMAVIGVIALLLVPLMSPPQRKI